MLQYTQSIIRYMVIDPSKLQFYQKTKVGCNLFHALRSIITLLPSTIADLLIEAKINTFYLDVTSVFGYMYMYGAKCNRILLFGYIFKF